MSSDWKQPLRHLKRRLEEWRFSGQSAPVLKGRYQLPSLLNARKLTGIGVEVGVYEGWFSHYLLQYWRGSKLISVDPWKQFDEGYRDDCNRNQAAMDALYASTREMLKPFGLRSEIWRLESEEAAPKVQDESLDFVYLDAQHHEKAIAVDIAVWWPKLRSAGMLAGHDYMDGKFPFGDFGVKTAVDRFVREQGLPLNVTREPTSPSWIVFKP